MTTKKSFIEETDIDQADLPDPNRATAKPRGGARRAKKKSTEALTRVVQFSVTDREMQSLRVEAAFHGQSISEFMRGLLRNQGRKAVEQGRQMVEARSPRREGVVE
jgi:hypothetical protein